MKQNRINNLNTFFLLYTFPQVFFVRLGCEGPVIYGYKGYLWVQKKIYNFLYKLPNILIATQI